MISRRVSLNLTYVWQNYPNAPRYDVRRTPENALQWNVDLITVELARLKQRVEDLEKAAYSEPSTFVEGWTRAARIVGVSEATARRRERLGQFPARCRTITIDRTDGKDHERPVWRRKDLVPTQKANLRRKSDLYSRLIAPTRKRFLETTRPIFSRICPTKAKC